MVNISLTSRTIDGGKLRDIVVQDDHNTVSVRFAIPLSLSEYALDQMTPYVVFKPDGVERESFKQLEDVSVSDGRIFCTWVIDRNSTAISGPLDFCITFTCGDAPNDTEDTHRWSTRLCTVIVHDK